MVWLVILFCAFFLLGAFAPLLPSKRDKEIAGSRTKVHKKGVKIIINPKKIKLPPRVEHQQDNMIQYYLPLSYPFDSDCKLPILWLLSDTSSYDQLGADKSVSTLVWRHWVGHEQTLNSLLSETGQCIEFANQLHLMLSKLPVDVTMVKLEQHTISIFWQESTNIAKLERVLDFLQKSNHYLSSHSHFLQN